MVSQVAPEVAKQTSSSDGKGKKSTYRDEWDSHHNTAVAKKEMMAWNLYDFANSPWYSSAAVLWFPILLLNYAKQTACPYAGLPHDQVGRNGGLWSVFDGFQNTSATCHVDMEIEGFGDWMCRGNSKYGLPEYPWHLRIWEPESTAEREKAKPYKVSEKVKWSLPFDDDDIPIICDEVTSDTYISPIRNVSLYSAHLPHGTEGWEVSGSVAIPFSTQLNGGLSSYTVDDFALTTSNPNVMETADQWSVVADTSVESADKQNWVLTVEPRAFWTGSTTVGLQVGDGEHKFTITAIEAFECPFTVRTSVLSCGWSVILASYANVLSCPSSS